MKLQVKLAKKSKKAWLKMVLDDFDNFLKDHADCERQASAMAMSFVARYPDRVETIRHLIKIATEELDDFKKVYNLMERRGVPLQKEMMHDLYVKQLTWLSGNARDQRFLDRMAIAAVVETRNAERFKMIADAMDDPELKEFYTKLHEVKMRHGSTYLELLNHYFEEQRIKERVAYFVEEEAKIIEELDLRPALH